MQIGADTLWFVEQPLHSSKQDGCLHATEHRKHIMTLGITRRTLLVSGSSVLLGAAGAGGLTVARRKGSGEATFLQQGYDRLCSDLDGAWWDTGSNTSYNLPGIRSTDGSGGWNTGRPNFNKNAPSVSNARGESFWQEAQYLRFLSNDRQLRAITSISSAIGAGVATARIEAQRKLWRSIYTTEELASNGASDGTVNVNDDAAWKLQSLKAIHQTSGNAEDLAILRRATIEILRHYVDTLTPSHQRTAGELTFSSFGCLYALPSQDRNGQGRATTYETGIMEAALYIARMEGAKSIAFRTYAQTVYESFKATLQKPSGIYFQALQLDPAGIFDATPFLKPIDARKAQPRQDYDGVTIGGTMAMAVIASELFHQTGNDRFRQDVIRIVAGIAAEYIQNGCILCDRDPWTAGVWGFDFARRALRLPDVDPNGRVAAAMIATGARILSTRTEIDVYTGQPAYGYSAEWSGNVDRSINESRTGANDGIAARWQDASARANNGRGGGPAAPNQIMTASSSAIMVQAAAYLATTVST